MTQATEVGTRLVALVGDGKYLEAVDQLYADDIVSIEPQGGEGMPARMEGIEAIRGKNQWWIDNHENNSTAVVGPFCGHRDDQFAVHYDVDVTNKTSGERMQMSEVALYTVRDGKIVQEEFLYRTS